MTSVGTLDLLADIATRGAIAGVGIRSTPAEWERAVGSDFLDDHAKKRFRRDYGLVELGFWRAGDEWRCGSLAVQVHRLWLGTDTIGPASLRQRCGGFPSSVTFADLRPLLPGLRAIADSDASEYARYYLPGSKITITVTTSSVEGYPPAGSVWALHLTDEPEIPLRPR